MLQEIPYEFKTMFKIFTVLELELANGAGVEANSLPQWFLSRRCNHQLL